jgi:osmoprotectant transport system substrate-binding protein
VKLSSTPGALACLIASLALSACSNTAAHVVIAPVNSTSQKILAEIIALRLGALGLQVDRTHTYDGVAEAHQAILAHEADIAIEYTGAAYMAILDHERPEPQAKGQLGDRVRSEYAGGQQLKWFEPLGFADPFVLVVQHGRVHTIGDAERQSPWTLGTGPEFLTRADGFDALMQAYPRLRWSKPAETMPTTALYGALSIGRANMIVGRAVDSRLLQTDVCALTDDQHLLPPEDASIVARFDSLAAHAGMEQALAFLSGHVSLQQMRAMDAEVENQHRAPSEVAAEFATRWLK